MRTSFTIIGYNSNFNMKFSFFVLSQNFFTLSDSAIILTQEFINDNITLKNEYVLIIHGIGSDILRKSVHEYLKREKKVLEFKRDFFNPGCTIVKLKFDK